MNIEVIKLKDKAPHDLLDPEFSDSRFQVNNVSLQIIIVHYPTRKLYKTRTVTAGNRDLNIYPK